MLETEDERRVKLSQVAATGRKKFSYTYDFDGRKTAEYDTTGGVAETRDRSSVEGGRGPGF